MDKFELRISDENDIWGEWMEVRDHQYIATHIFDRAKFIRTIRYEYNDGTCIEYRRIKKDK